MPSLQDAVGEFMALKRVAVAGVSRDRNQAANAIYRRLRGAGYQVFALNPRAREVEGDPCYPDLKSVPGGAEGLAIEGVVIATPPTATDAVVRDCLANGVSHVWMHRSFGRGSVSAEAVRLCREHGISVIDGACPLMYCPPVDVAHKCIRWILKLTGGLPRPHAG